MGAGDHTCGGYVLSRRLFLRSSAAVAGGSALAAFGLGSVSAARTRQQGQSKGNPNGTTLITCAHADDNLLFMSPDEYTLIAGGGSVRVVYLTTGDAGKGQTYWEGREQGAQAGAANMAGLTNPWTSGTYTVRGHSLPMVTLESSPDISIIFMRLPDGGDGNGYADTDYESLMKLWTGEIKTIESADGDVYKTNDLVNTLASIIHKYKPDTVFTQNFDGSFGNGDHTDHVATGFLTQAAATTLSPIPFNVYGYQGYPVSSMPANVSGTLLAAKENAFEAYAPYDVNACSPLGECYAPGFFEDTYGTWLPRQYQVAEISAGT
jgi:LmbE family N-acetylglucosaminyl deacetylase